MRLLVLGWSWLAAGCSLSLFGGGELTYAAGGVGDLSPLYTECTAPADDPQSPVRFRFVNKNIFEAAAPGEVKLRCKDDTLKIVVRRAARLSVRPVRVAAGRQGAPDPQSGEMVVDELLELAVDAHDERGRELIVGHQTEIGWLFSGALTGEKSPGGNDSYRPPRTHGFARSTRVGQGEVRARFGGLEGKRVIRVRSRTSGGEPAR